MVTLYSRSSHNSMALLLILKITPICLIYTQICTSMPLPYLSLPFLSTIKRVSNSQQKCFEFSTSLLVAFFSFFCWLSFSCLSIVSWGKIQKYTQKSFSVYCRPEPWLRALAFRRSSIQYTMALTLLNIYMQKQMWFDNDRSELRIKLLNEEYD